MNCVLFSNSYCTTIHGGTLKMDENKTNNNKYARTLHVCTLFASCSNTTLAKYQYIV